MGKELLPVQYKKRYLAGKIINFCKNENNLQRTESGKDEKMSLGIKAAIRFHLRIQESQLMNVSLQGQGSWFPRRRKTGTSDIDMTSTPGLESLESGIQAGVLCFRCGLQARFYGDGLRGGRMGGKACRRTNKAIITWKGMEKRDKQGKLS